jgi:hypothetical protein
MSLQGFPKKITVTLGSAWTGRFGLSNGTTLDLHRGSCANNSCQWSEDGTANFNKTTNRIMLTFKNNINIPNNGSPYYTPTGSYGTAQAGNIRLMGSRLLTIISKTYLVLHILAALAGQI